MSEFLASKLDRQKTAERDRLAAIVSFEDWMQEIVSFNRESTADLKRLAELMEENTAKRPRLNDLSQNFTPSPASFTPSSFHYPPPFATEHPQSNKFIATGANAVTPASFRQTENTAPRWPVNSLNAPKRNYCPPLTDNKKSLLNK